MGSVLKSDQQVTIAKHEAFNFDDMTLQAKNYLAQIRVQAGELLKDAKEQADRLRAEAQTQGEKAAIRVAERKVEQMVEARLNTVLPALGQAAAEISNLRRSTQRQWEGQLIDLACAIAGKVIRQEVSNQPEIPLQLIREALQLATGSSEIKLRLNPHDLNALGDHIEAVKQTISGLGEVEIKADPAISRGGCQVDSKFGCVDQQIESQLARIANELGS